MIFQPLDTSSKNNMLVPREIRSNIFRKLWPWTVRRSVSPTEFRFSESQLSVWGRKQNSVSRVSAKQERWNFRFRAEAENQILISAWKRKFVFKKVAKAWNFDHANFRLRSNMSTFVFSPKPKVAAFLFALKTKVDCPFQREREDRFPRNVQSPSVFYAAAHMLCSGRTVSLPVSVCDGGGNKTPIRWSRKTK